MPLYNLSQNTDSLKKLGTYTGRSPYVAIKNYLNNGYETDQKHFVDDLKWLSKVLRDISTNINTRDQRFTEVRKILMKLYPGEDNNEKMRIHFKFSKTERQTKVAAQTKARTKQLKEVMSFNVDRVFEVVSELKLSSDPLNKILLLIMATGRRKIDVLKVTDLPTQVKSKYNGKGIFIDQVSKGSKDESKKRKDFVVPLLFISYTDMVDAWELVRQLIKDRGEEKLTNSRLGSRYGEKLNKRIRELFPDLKKRFSQQKVGTHILRKIYGAEAVRTFKPNTTNPTVFLNEVLGHVEGSEGVALNYSNIETNKPEIRTEPQLRQALDNTKQEVVELKQEVKKITSKVINPTLKRMIEVVKTMKAAGKKVTVRSVKAEGKFGSTSVERYLQIAKDAANEEPQPAQAPAEVEEKQAPAQAPTPKTKPKQVEQQSRRSSRLANKPKKTYTKYK